jgi:hypothetical protein
MNMLKLTHLQTALLDLLHGIQDTDIKFIIGGGFGIYLKTEFVRQRALRTLFREWPTVRSTNDLDLFLRPELLIDSIKLKPLSAAIIRLGYRVIPGAEKYQFIKPGPGGMDAGSIKIDILTGPQIRFKGTRVKVDARRARPTPSVGIHAHPVNEASTLEIGLLPETVVGNLSSGEAWQGEVLLPHPFTFSMMKLFAFKDRLNDSNKEFGRYHALDIYTILATTTEAEWGQALELRDQHWNEPPVMEAGDLVAEYFSTRECFGMIRLRESRYYRPELQLGDFMSVLQELFPTGAKTIAQKK